MSDCLSLAKKLIPLSKVVNAALIDSYADAGRAKEIYFHWAARGLKKLQTEQLKMGKRSVTLTVNHNTKTATLPPDFDYETFVGVINTHGFKVPLNTNNKLVSSTGVEDIACETLCEKCNQNKAICEDLDVTEEKIPIIIDGSPYNKTVIKKLYPNGDYYLETSTPYRNTITNAIEYATVKEFIVALDLKSCGCLETTDENIEKVKACNHDVYDCYFAPCSSVCDTTSGGYKIFEELGLIQLDLRFPYDKLYLEYIGFMQKVNGQYAVPQVAFETLVELTKFKAVENRSNVNLSERNWYFQNYLRERRNMERIMSRVSLSVILNAARRVPRFEIDWNDEPRTLCAPTSSPYVSEITSSTICASAIAAAAASTSVTTINLLSYLKPFQLAVVCNAVTGTPKNGLFTYTHPELIGATNINYIIVNNNNETIKLDVGGVMTGDFTFNSLTGTITRDNAWVFDDKLIIPFAKLVNS